MRKYDDEFKHNAVRKILDGQSAASLSREIGVAESLLHKWKRAKIETGSELEKQNSELVIDVFLQARRRALVGKHAIIHTDRGSQYASVEYRRLLYINGCRQSMSRKGNCYENAQAESFFSRFKAELVEDGIFESVAEAQSEIFSYIEGCCNRVRLHSDLGFIEV